MVSRVLRGAMAEIGIKSELRGSEATRQAAREQAPVPLNIAWAPAGKQQPTPRPTDEGHHVTGLGDT